MRTRRRSDVAPTKLTDRFIMHRLEWMESPAWRATPDNARRILCCLEIEHLKRGGWDNGRLVQTYDQFSERGDVRLASVALAIRQAVALGMLEVTRVGKKSAGGFKIPSLYRLTYVTGCARGDKGGVVFIDPTDEWRVIATAQDAAAALAEAEPTPKKRPRLGVEAARIARAG